MEAEPSNYFEAQEWLANARNRRIQARDRASAPELAPSSSSDTSQDILRGIQSLSPRPNSFHDENSASRRRLHVPTLLPPANPSPGSTSSSPAPTPNDRRNKNTGTTIPQQDCGLGRLLTSTRSLTEQTVGVSEALATENPIQLSEEQKHILQSVKKGNNVFFTGPAGTGKSVVLREIIAWARERHRKKDAVAITAPTGIAAVNIGGRSLHSWAGIKLGKEDANTLVNNINKAKATRKRWTDVEILIIDEISMLDGNLFDKLETIARNVREIDEPFGGIQLIITGDFFQLPPVPEKSYKYEMAATFAFQAKAWSTCIPRPQFLKQIFRQTDTTFIDILSGIREGCVTDEHTATLQRLDRTIEYADGIEATELYPLRRDVENCNSKRLAALAGETVSYKAIDKGGVDVFGNRIPYVESHKLAERLIALESVNLKVGAQVMLIQNTVQGKLVNGSVGVVTSFLTVAEAVGMHIHMAGISYDDKRFQGSTDDTLIEVIKKLKLVEPDVHYDAINKFTNFSVEQRWPFVHFTNGMDLLCVPVDFTVVGVKGNVEATRSQVPLILAWAISIHKSQGQTLPRVRIDLEHIFEKGQAYVALSRATSMDGLEIRNLNPAKIQVHPLVLQWQQFWSSLGEFDAEFMDSELDSFFEPVDDDFF